LNAQARISVLCIPTGDTHITSDMCAGIHISRGYTYHCDRGTHVRRLKFTTSHVGISQDSYVACRNFVPEELCRDI